MVIQHLIGLFSNPTNEWSKIKANSCSATQCLLKHVAFMALIPAVSGYIGTTKVGWSIGASGTHYLHNDSAAIIAVLTYFAMLAGVIGMGYMIQWMSDTYGKKQELGRCIVFAAYVASPLFLIGFMMLYPIMWLNMLIGLPAIAYTVFLLYNGLPIVMEIEKEKGFLFASAIVGLGMVALVAILATSILLWGFGFGPTSVSY